MTPDMRSTFRLPLMCVLGAVVVSGAMSAMAADGPVPGHYQVTTRTTYTDVPLPPTTVTNETCLTAEDLERDPASAFAALPDGKSCDVSEFEMSGGIFRMRVNCATPEGDMIMITEGSYDASGYLMTSHVEVTAGEQVARMQSEIQGKLLGDC